MPLSEREYMKHPPDCCCEECLREYSGYNDNLKNTENQIIEDTTFPNILDLFKKLLHIKPSN
jgi:hypothetical protein